jgi:hypothetical protein
VTLAASPLRPAWLLFVFAALTMGVNADPRSLVNPSLPFSIGGSKSLFGLFSFDDDRGQHQSRNRHSGHKHLQQEQRFIRTVRCKRTESVSCSPNCDCRQDGNARCCASRSSIRRGARRSRAA